MHDIEKAYRYLQYGMGTVLLSVAFALVGLSSMITTGWTIRMTPFSVGMVLCSAGLWTVAAWYQFASRRIINNLEKRKQQWIGGISDEP